MSDAVRNNRLREVPGTNALRITVAISQRGILG